MANQRTFKNYWQSLFNKGSVHNDDNFLLKDSENDDTLRSVTWTVIKSNLQSFFSNLLPTEQEKEALSGTDGDPSVSNKYVTDSDSRLYDARTPTTHSHSISDLPVASSGSSSSTHIVRADDSRLNDSRTPTAHNHDASHINAGTLNISRIPTGSTSSTVCIGNDSRLSDARTPTAHNHILANITDSGDAAGKNVGTGADDVAAGNHNHSGVYDPAGTASSAITAHENNHPIPTNRDERNAAASHSHGISDLPVASSGSSSSTQVVRADDSRLSDARTPTAHNHNADHINAGTLNIARIPIGTSSSQVAAGNHNHSGTYEPVLNADQKRKITYGTADPSGGSDGDIYMQYDD